jgi:hypothetical protein
MSSEYKRVLLKWAETKLPNFTDGVKIVDVRFEYEDSQGGCPSCYGGPEVRTCIDYINGLGEERTFSTYNGQYSFSDDLGGILTELFAIAEAEDKEE